MLRAMAYTQGVNTPSARFRIRQYFPYLAEQGVALSESWARFGSYPPGPGWRRLPWLTATTLERSLAAVKGNAFDAVLFQREMVSTLYTAERLCRTPAVLDVDDAIWLTQRGGGIDQLARQCSLILCGNDYLAEHFSALAPVEILPTGVDTSHWQPGVRAQTPVIVWSGSASGLPYVYELEPALREVMQVRPDLRLRICSNAMPQFKTLSPERVDFVPWSPEAELGVVQSAWLGLMPMPDTPWTRGKCSFKMLTYMACGVPCVAAPWGMNAQVIAGGGALGAITLQDWREHMLALLDDPDAAAALGRQGRIQVENHYATAQLAGVLAQALKRAGGRGG
ncbi:glycosyltransferase family 4 protein [Uliginosibacterium gangwonense]|uniref:glycosyltransferase family 4 protein n=1 Tax=Uliginosibacterium gangwonense TaxID=392736 RepID=UPI00037A9103|nr:glycosyltransferase family 4 protein [Uliginosibacterium gangwonense]